MQKVYKILSLFLLLLIPILIVGQNRSDLEKKRRANKNAIELTRQVLEKTKNRQVKSLQSLTLFQEQIKQREELILSINSALDNLDFEIEKANEDIAALKREIDEMKEEFSSLLYQAYKMRRKKSMLYFILSASSFNQAIKRLHFIRDLVQYRKKQMDLIVQKQKENSGNIFRLVQKKNSQLSLLNERKDEMEALEQDKLNELELIEELKGKEKELQEQLKKQKQIDKELNNAIQKAIAAEIERSKRIAKQKENDRDISVERKTTTIGSSFDKNKGNMPWPVSYGRISQKFGVHKHPKFKNITTENNGINIATKDGASVKSVFDGTVSAVLQIPGMKNSVLVKHGNYYTVYANLDEVYVVKDETITRGEDLGKVLESENGITEFHFEVWHGSRKLNPEPWLIKL